MTYVNYEKATKCAVRNLTIKAADQAHVESLHCHLKSTKYRGKYENK